MPTVTITRFDGGVSNDPLDQSEGTSRIVTNFDIFCDPRRMCPYRDSESADSAPTTSQKQNFAFARRTGTTWSIYALGVVSGTARAEVLYKDFGDLGALTWNTPSNNASSAGTADMRLFVAYRRTDLIYGARAGTNIWAFSPTGSAFADSHQALTYSEINQGLVHSKDDILYIPYYNSGGFIAKNDNGSWSTTALTLPVYENPITISEYGNYLAIGCEPFRIGGSTVYLWDRDSSLSTLSEKYKVDGNIRILEEVQGELIAISVLGGKAENLDDKVIFSRLVGGVGFVRFAELRGDIGTLGNSIPAQKQKHNNRLHFMMSISIDGTQRDGVWSVGRSPNGAWAINHERTPNNDTALSSPVLANFLYVGDFLFQAYQTSSAWALSSTNDQNNYTATSIWEKRFNHGDSAKEKQLLGGEVMHEYLPSAGQVVVKYKKDNETSFTTLTTNTTDNTLRTLFIRDTNGATLPNYREITFRIESTGNAVITGLKFKYKELADAY